MTALPDLINDGAVANDGTGDTARVAFGKINVRFSGETITSGASPVAADPDKAVTYWTTSGTKTPDETVTLANSTQGAGFRKTIFIDLGSGGDDPVLQITNVRGATSPISISNSQPLTLVLEWDGDEYWRIIFGGAVNTMGSDINAGGGDISAGDGEVSGGSVHAGNGVSGTFTVDEGTLEFVDGVLTTFTPV